MESLNKNQMSRVARSSETELPDVSHETKPAFAGRLSQVGMSKIEMPIRMQFGEETCLLPALVDTYVSLDDPEAKGIHMSRLYLELKNHLQQKKLTFCLIKEILDSFLNSHKGLSEESFLRIQMQVPVERKALLSSEVGYRQYPVTLEGHLSKQGLKLSLGVEVLYSSTCPCSAALVRQVAQDEFSKEFTDLELVPAKAVKDWLSKEDAIAAVPHAQRSRAVVKISVRDWQFAPQIIDFITSIENALGTPVQAAVKRVDEQEFARLNGQNLMFCEDAARKLKSMLDRDNRVEDYDIMVEHQESLHPHNAVSRVVKGFPV